MFRDDIIKRRDFKYSMIFGGSNLRYRNRLRRKMKEELKKRKFGIAEKWTPKKYFNYVTYSISGMSVRGEDEYCYRDMEYMMPGIPFVRKSFRNLLYENIMPNKHYLSIPDSTTIEHVNHLCNYFKT